MYTNDATNYDLHLRGYVGGDDFDATYVGYVLDQRAGQPVRVLIDSLGGSVPTALSVANAFERHGQVDAHFVGMNASAATIAALGAKRVTMDPHAMYLAHKCSQSFFEWGHLNADQFAELIADLSKMKEDLDKLDLNIARMYASRCKKQPEDILALMERGGWLTAEEAVEWGFVDAIEARSAQPAPTLTTATASALAAAGIPLPPLPILDHDRAAGFWAQLRDFISSLFTTTNSTTMTEELTAAVEAAQPDRVAELEAAVAERDARIAELEAAAAEANARIAELSAAPGDETANITETGSREAEAEAEAEDSEWASYMAVSQTARALYDSLP